MSLNAQQVRIRVSSERIRESGEQFRENIEELTARLMENVEDLEKIAGVYEQSEHAAQEGAEALPENVIV